MSTQPAVRLDRLPDVPDFLGVGARVKTVADLIETAQGQLQNLQAIRIINGHQETDPVPTDGAQGATYAERFQALTDGMRSLIAANQDIADELTAEAVKRRKQTE